LNLPLAIHPNPGDDGAGEIADDDPMSVSLHPFPRRVAAAGLLFILAACAGTPPEATTPTPAVDVAARTVFEAGFVGIAERYVEPISVDALALEGMRGLGALDPAITIARRGQSVALRSGDVEVRRFDIPADGDVRAWAALTARISAAGREASSELAAFNDERVFEAVFDGALARLDTFSRYASAEEANRNRSRREGYGGVGIAFRMGSDSVRVVDVIRGSPADLAGLRVGDRISHINAQPVDGLTKANVGKRLRGPVGSRVILRLGRDDPERLLTLAINRVHIIPPTVGVHVTDGVLEVRIRGFNHGTAAEVGEALDLLHDPRTTIRGVAIDLRSNPGGLLLQAVRVADLFLDHGRIVATHGRHPDSLQSYEAGGRDLAGGRPVVVLVDGKSASAAEIVAAALQELGRAVVVGTDSYGKGTVQTVVPLPNSGEILITWSRLVPPSGLVLDGRRVHPTICTSGGEHGTNPSADELIAESAAAQVDAACPPEPRDGTLEAVVARRLLADRALYERALRAGRDVAQAIH